MISFSEEKKELIEREIQEKISSIEISRTNYEQAEKHYQAIGKWLQREDSKLTKVSPDVYTQGSFALGTVIKPFNNSEEYDIDLVCHLKLGKGCYSQEEIKNTVGEELKKYAYVHSLSHIPEESRRCWRMRYKSSNNSVGFHLDVLPAISDLSYTEAKEKFKQFEETDYFKVSITDNEKENYNQKLGDWPLSNPKGYAKWFNFKQQYKIQEISNKLTTTIVASTEAVPKYLIKTPLQKTIQFLKRHRDIYFQDYNDIKPISIIITTLVAQTYSNKDKVIDIIKDFLDTFKEHIENGSIIRNPVNPDENFADKWADYPERREAFYEWTEKLADDFIIQSQNNKNKIYTKPLAVNNLQQHFPDVSHRVEELQYPDSPIKSKVNITAKYRKISGDSRTRPFRSGNLIDKNCKITFKVNDKNIRGKKKYYWQVVNNGDEASSANDTRGDFQPGEEKRGHRTRIEKTAYTGFHWVQCFIIQNDECIAQSPRFVVNVN